MCICTAGGERGAHLILSGAVKRDQNKCEACTHADKPFLSGYVYAAQREIISRTKPACEYKIICDKLGMVARARCRFRVDDLRRVNAPLYTDGALCVARTGEHEHADTAGNRSNACRLFAIHDCRSG
jgi:hypothetical protein